MSGLLEICVDSLASARAAISGGADRLELCSALSIGGLTPYSALLSQIRGESNIAIRCLMRPRAGDFLYTPEEIQMMANQIRTLRSLGADGFVIGCLTPEGMLDKEAMKPLIEAADGAGLTLHRCIDVSADLCQTYLDARDLGMNLIDAGHFPTENPVVALLAAKLTANFPDVTVKISETHRDCMKFF